MLSLLIASCIWAVLTGTFFASPTLPIWVGGLGLGIAIAYSLAFTVWGQGAMIFAIAITCGITFLVVLQTGFSIVNYAVVVTIALNFLLFGRLGRALSATRSRGQVGRMLAVLFSGALALGWLVGLIME